MGPLAAITTCFMKYATFRGRARRSEYWWWLAFYVLVALVCGAIGSAVGAGQTALIGIGFLAIILPTWAVTVRRLHDTSRSGWYILLGLIPVLGGLIMIYLLIQDADFEPNEYGPSPKAAPSMP